MPEADRSSTAEKLLLSMLTPAQRADYRDFRCFAVTGSRGGKYQIDTRSTVSNIHAENGTRYCVVPVRAEVMFEIWLGQKLLIEADEVRFLRIAVASEGVR